MEESSAKLTKTQIHGGLVLVHGKLGNSLEKKKHNFIVQNMGGFDEIWEFSDESELLCPKNDRYRHS